jgi:uncharacterized protein (TIGR01777 family)
MRVFITGGTGLIGRQVVQRLAKRGDTPVVLSRNVEKARKDATLNGAEFVSGDPASAGDWTSAVDGCDAVIHLAGHGVFTETWTEEVKRKIRDSRVLSTQRLVEAIAASPHRPRVLVQGSAIGYYGSRGDEILTETSPPGDDFLARVAIEWEGAAQPAVEMGLRVPILRTGIVLARGAGALGIMTPLFRIAPGAPIGSGGTLWPAAGRQWMSWIHLIDIVGLVLLALDNPDASGPLNGTAPNPVRNAEFARQLSRALWRPYAPWRFALPFGPPDAVLRLVLGEVAEVVTSGQRAVPERAQALGYAFRFPDLPAALADLFGRASRAAS